MSVGDLSIKSGEYVVDKTSWFDIRYSDMGLCLSLCDLDMNQRFTVIIDEGKVVFSEIDRLIREPDAISGSDSENCEM